MSDDDIVSVKVDASRVNLKLEQLPDDVRARLSDVIYLLAGVIADQARGRAESLLQVKTGHFVRSINDKVLNRKNSITGRVSSSAKTANLFEWGGKTGAHEILPNQAKALLINGRFAARVHHPGGQYAPRNIIHGAFDPMKPEIVAELEAAVNGAVAHANEAEI